MKQCFRIALWMVLLVGYLQAKPITSEPEQKACAYFNMSDLGLTYLKEVSCKPNVTFTSPTFVPIHCYTAALEIFKKGLKQATNESNCRDELGRADSTLEALEQNTVKAKSSSRANASNCTGMWGNKPFADFADDFLSFVQKVNTDPDRC